jgi:hypothetical protein
VRKKSAEGRGRRRGREFRKRGRKKGVKGRKSGGKKIKENRKYWVMEAIKNKNNRKFKREKRRGGRIE